MKNYLKILSGSSNPELAQEICDYLAIVPPLVARSSASTNDNIKVKIEENVREDDVFVIQTSVSPVNHHFVELLLLIDALKYASSRPNYGRATLLSVCARRQKRTNPAFLLAPASSPTYSKWAGGRTEF